MNLRFAPTLAAWGLTVGAAAAPSALQDKTLVVWVAPGNLTQQGGSALTVDDGETHFDGVVFGELARGKWMPGSDSFRRTLSKQEDWPGETADPQTLVQIAITYHEREVTMYRDGQPYASYVMANPPQAFGPTSIVVMGMRHPDQTSDAHFAGAIEDARIYDQALTVEQVRALRADQPSEPKPWAWWTFADARAAEQTGRFQAVKLVGGARVENGRLLLDGKQASLFAAPTSDDLPPQAITPAVSAADIATSRRLREQLLADPHRPNYHFVIPEGSAMPFDPNGAIFWKGRYHLFYIFQDERGHNWGHVSSTDLLHWRHHPTGLTNGMFSGNCFLNKEGRPTMCYHQVGQGNAMAVAVDDELNEWKKLESNPITPKTKPGDPFHDKYRSWDPFGWREGDTYYAIFGGEHPGLVKAPTLGGEWKYVGDFLANTVDGVSINEDVSCADFFKLGDRYMLLCISHRLGARYYLGTWQNEQFHPTFHEKMSWVDNAFFAPESLLDSKGRRIMWSWLLDGPLGKTRTPYGWSGTMSLPRVLSLGDDGRLRMHPPEELGRLRYNGQQRRDIVLAADTDHPLDGIAGTSLELNLTVQLDGAQQVGLAVCRSPGGEEQTLLYYDAAEKKLKVDTTRSTLKSAPKNVEAGPLELPAGEALRLQVFIDKSVVEVFANGRQAVTRRVFPSRRDSTGIHLFSKGGAARVTSLQAWEMMPSNPY